jgi:hypothetical protein
MRSNNDETQDPLHFPEVPYSEEELRAFQAGTSAIIMPASDGWKVSYISGLDVEKEEGTVFASFEEVMAAVADLLPKANSDEELAKYAEMEELVRLRRQIAGEYGEDGR